MGTGFMNVIFYYSRLNAQCEHAFDCFGNSMSTDYNCIGWRPCSGNGIYQCHFILAQIQCTSFFPFYLVLCEHSLQWRHPFFRHVDSVHDFNCFWPSVPYWLEAV